MRYWSSLHGRAQGNQPGTFDPKDSDQIKHTREGVWDVYVQKFPDLARIPGSYSLERRLEVLKDFRYVWRMFKDTLSIEWTWFYLSIYLLCSIAEALIPAVSLWCTANFLGIIQAAIENKEVDTQLLFLIVLGQTACEYLREIIAKCKTHVEIPFTTAIEIHFSLHTFNASARLDVPTFVDPVVQRKLQDVTGYGTNVVWNALRTLFKTLSTGVRLLSQVSVLASVLRSQKDGSMYAVVSFLEVLFKYSEIRYNSDPLGPVWAATTEDEDYIKLKGLQRISHGRRHRQELTAGNMKDHLINQYRQASSRVPEPAEFGELCRRKTRTRKTSVYAMLLCTAPRIVYLLRALQNLKTLPMALTSMQLVEQTTQEFMWLLASFVGSTGSIGEQVQSIRQLYEIENIPNKIVDGTIPFPEDSKSARFGTSVEFRYPDTERDALKDVSFKIERGQLCVIVGTNGSGKSTILKLITRIFDPTKGQILIDGMDIKTMKLADLRQTISVLFQDYTYFPLTIKENIGIGDPSNAHDEDKIRLAARLGGAEELIDKLPDGFNTYLKRPVRDHFSNIPEGTKTLFGRPVDLRTVRTVMGGRTTDTTLLSGGQMQRLAVSRTFMRSIVSDEDKVGLLLFDEPSAALDPQAEHDLFVRLRKLRGNKTMLFSSHRFGQLTRHADVILYMNDSAIIEVGNHDELIKQGGKYSELWKMQAQAFV